MTLELPASLTQTVFETTGILFGVKGRVTEDMKPYVKEVSANGNPIFDSKLVLERLDVAGRMIRDHEFPVVYATDPRFKNALIGFNKATNRFTIEHRLRPGTLSNPQMKGYAECDLLLVADPTNGIPTKIGQPLMGDRRAMHEASSQGIPVIAICNSNATFADVDLAIPANNLGTKAIATVFYVLAYSVLRDLNAEVPPLETFETVMPDEEYEESLNKPKED
jgi:small subunit ribosomal protein S2